MQVAEVKRPNIAFSSPDEVGFWEKLLQKRCKGWQTFARVAYEKVKKRSGKLICDGPGKVEM